jgi:hypothetical protein
MIMAKSIYPWGDYPELNGGPKSSEHEGRFSGFVKPAGKSVNSTYGNAQNKANGRGTAKK